MKKIVIVMCALFAFVGGKQLSADIHFSSPQSTINLNANSKFYIDTAVLPVVGGTVTQVDTAEIFGGSIEVSNDGRFLHGGGDTTSVGLYGNFSQLANGTFVLAGNTKLAATFGTIDGPINVSSTNNRIEGNAYLQNPITLLDSNTSLTLAVDNVINQPIILNGGTLVLEADVALGYNGKIVGPGIVDGQGAGSLRLSGTADQWSTELIFRNMHTIGLTGATTLTGTWSFEGESNLVGGGSTLDLLAEGCLNLEHNAVLKLSGVNVNNVVQNCLSLAPTSTLLFSDVNLSLSVTMTITSGTYLVKGGASTFRIGQQDLSFTATSLLLVDGGTVWLDCADNTGFFLFQGDNYPYIRKINGGQIRQLTDLAHISSESARRLLNGNVFTDIVLSQNLTLEPNQIITYSGNAQLDGGGVEILFSKGDLSQLNIPTGITATFKNVNLLRIANNTLNVSSGGTMRMLNDVLWELDQDVVLTEGRYVLGGATDVLRIRGNGGRKKLTLAPLDDHFAFIISSNTVLLEDIELVGIENVQYSFTVDPGNNRIVGVVGVTDTSVVDITRDTNMSLLVQGRDAGIVLLANNVTLSGSILFGLAPENVLNVFFALQSGADLPNVSFADGFCPLTSVGGNAGINFLNDQVTLNLLRDKSVVAGERSFISGKAITITTNPIRVASTQFTVRQGTDLAPSGMPNPIDLISSRTPTLFDDLNGGLFSAHQLHEFSTMRSLAEARYKTYLNDCVNLRSMETRGRILIPTPTVRVMGRMALSRGVGDIALTAGGSLTRFLPDNWVPFSVSLTGGSKLEQKRVRALAPIPLRDPAELQIASDGTFAGLKEVDTLYVTKGQNVVAVSSDFNILGNLSIDEGAELIFQLSDGATLTFGNYQDGATPSWIAGVPLGYQLTLPKNSTIRFVGNGTVRFADGSQIICQGSTFSANIAIDNPRYFNDDRPEIIVSDNAQLSVADHRRLTVQGRGKINVTTNGEINVADGKLTLGAADSDYFDLKVSRHGYVRASIPRSLSSDNYTLASRIIFNQGFFNLYFTDRSALEIGDRGIVEMSLNNNAQTHAFINSWTFASQGALTVSQGGTLSLGDNRYAPAGNANVILPVNWDNRGGDITGGGIIQAVDGTVEGGRVLFQAILQKEFFATSSSVNLDIVKSLSKVTTSLIKGLDYKLANGTYQLTTGSGVSVTLKPTDVLISEDARTGDITGLQSDGQSFKITSGGLRLIVS